MHMTVYTCSQWYYAEKEEG